MTTSSSTTIQLINEAVGLHRAGELDDAARIYRGVLLQEPANSDALNLLGVIERQCENYDSAITLLLQAVAHGTDNPNLADFHNNLGECYRAVCNFTAAIQSYDAALLLRPDFDAAIYNKGNLLQQTARQHEAIACYQRTLQINPDHHKARFAISISELLLEDFAQGWRHYQLRQHTKSFQFPVPDVITQFDDAPELAGKRVLLVHEQGLGDELFFLRFIPRLRELGADISYWPSEKLRPLLATASMLKLVGPKDDTAGFDYRFSVCDAALLAGMNTIHDIPGSLKLKVPTETVNPLATIGVALPRPWIGISWRSGTEGSYFKQLPLTELLAIFRHFKGTLFVMQRNPIPEELVLIQGELPEVTSIDCSDLNDNLIGALYLLNQLDRYLCVSNTNLHLRAALRKRCDVLVPVAGDFRWPNTRPNAPGAPQKSPWFGEFPLYRQRLDGSWAEALAAARNAMNL